VERLFDLGIDGVIANQSGPARQSLHAYVERPGTGLAARRIRAWRAD
jgi:hypothetical protein